MRLWTEREERSKKRCSLIDTARACSKHPFLCMARAAYRKQASFARRVGEHHRCVQEPPPAVELKGQCTACGAEQCEEAVALLPSLAFALAKEMKPSTESIPNSPPTQFLRRCERVSPSISLSGFVIHCVGCECLCACSARETVAQAVICGCRRTGSLRKYHHPAKTCWVPRRAQVFCLTCALLCRRA